MFVFGILSNLLFLALLGGIVYAIVKGVSGRREQAGAESAPGSLRRVFLFGSLYAAVHFAAWGIAGFVDAVTTSGNVAEPLAIVIVAVPVAALLGRWAWRSLGDPAERGPTFALYLNFMLHTGCRPGEAVAIRLNDIKGTPPSWIVLRKHKTSNSTGKPREIPLGPSTGRMVDCARRHWPTFEPSRPLFCRPLPNGDLVALTTNGLLQAVRKACRALECSHFCPYQIRHTTAQLVLNECGSEAVTSALLGHSPSSTIVRTYTKDRKNLAEYGAATLSKALSR